MHGDGNWIPRIRGKHTLVLERRCARLPILDACRRSDLHGVACLRNRHRPEALEEQLDLLPGPLLEQVVVPRSRKNRHALRLVGLMKHAASLIEWDDLVAAAMENAEWHCHFGDAIDGAILIDHDDVERKALPQQLAHLDD